MECDEIYVQPSLTIRITPPHPPRRQALSTMDLGPPDDDRTIITTRSHQTRLRRVPCHRVDHVRVSLWLEGEERREASVERLDNGSVEILDTGLFERLIGSWLLLCEKTNHCKSSRPCNSHAPIYQAVFALNGAKSSFVLTTVFRLR